LSPTKNPSFTSSKKPTIAPSTAIPSSASTTSLFSVAPSSSTTLKPTLQPTQLVSSVPTIQNTVTSTASTMGSVTFFDASQSYLMDNSSINSNTVTTNGFSFTYSQDKLFTGGYGLYIPVGRYNAVFWPVGLHLQAITTGTFGSAQATITRTDKKPFSIESFTARLLCNTAGPGADFEWVPKLKVQKNLIHFVFI
jgi:hypothetical protein